LIVTNKYIPAHIPDRLDCARCSHQVVFVWKVVGVANQ
jgi:hypothetical protein